MWNDVQDVLGEYLARFKPATAYMYSKEKGGYEKGGYLKVGATYQAYEFGGNQVSFVVDRTFTREYGTNIHCAIIK